MATSVHSVARDLLVAAYQDADVATAANVLHVTWVGRVLKGDKDGYIGSSTGAGYPLLKSSKSPVKRGSNLRWIRAWSLPSGRSACTSDSRSR